MTALTSQRSNYTADHFEANQNLHHGTSGSHGSKSLANRVAALEVKVDNKTIQEQFHEQAERIDRLFVYRFDDFDKKWDEKLETRLETKLKPIRTDPNSVKNDVAIIKDVLKIVLERLP